MLNDNLEKVNKPPDGSENQRNNDLPEIELQPSIQQEMLATVCLALIYIEKEIGERQVLVQQLNDELGSLLEQLLAGECIERAKQHRVSQTS